MTIPMSNQQLCKEYLKTNPKLSEFVKYCISKGIIPRIYFEENELLSIYSKEKK
jgi:hypothetical protein